MSGCATAPAADWATVAARNPAPRVVAVGETEPVSTANADAADDPAIWRDPADPSRSLIIGTDKKAGLYVYGVDGRRRSFFQAGRVNNVDLVEARVAGRAAILVAASDRNDPAAGKVALFTLDPASAALTALGTVPAGAGEAYGLCLSPRGQAVDAFVVMKDGTIAQVALDLAEAAPAGRVVRTLKLATQSEGCVVDPRTRRLYVGEEDAGIWRFDADPAGSPTPVKVAGVDGKTLVADVEGLAVVAGAAGGGWLLASSQGDNAYAVYDLATERFLGRFRVGPGKFGATSETDGIAAMAGDFGAAFPGGLFIAQDGDNAPAAQNFKLVPLAAIAAALGRPLP
ncbi:phytase [Sphingomonas sp.]|uniref:phytase n=1 Tax=Sphingomonas sp. TaxID=28214 RepID=UPI003B3A74C0